MLRHLGTAAVLALLAGPALAQSKLTVAAYGGVWDSHLREKVFPEFEKKHIVTKKRGKRRAQIKRHDETCQFLGADRRCTVYESRPKDCRGYVCWNQEDTTVFDYARFFQLSIGEVRQQDVDAGVKAR